jgi:hypothetical protein
MDLLGIIILVVVLGLVWWVLTTYVPMPPAGRTVLAIVFVVVLLVALLNFLGVGTEFLHYKPRL